MAFSRRHSTPLLTPSICFVLESLCNKFAGILSKVAVDFTYIVVLLTKTKLVKNIVGVGLGSWGKGILEKSLLGQERKELFRKTKKVYIEIFNIHYTFKVLGNSFPGLLK